MTDIVSIGFKVDTSQIAAGTQRMEKFGATAQKTGGKVTQSIGGIGRSFGQAGIQIQQFVGQVQGGISPMVAMSQQAADLGIVLGAPLLGVLASFAASIGMVVAPALFDADDAADKLKDTLEALDKVVTQTAGGAYTLSAEIARLAKVSETAANAQIALSITEATQAINLARDSADEAIESFDDLFNGFDVVSTPETLNKLNDAMQRTGLSAAELLNSSNLYATGLTQIKSFSDSLGDSLGTTTADSIKLIQAVSDFRQGGSVSQLAETFSTISLSTSGATKEFQALAVNLNNLSLTTEKSEAVLDLLKSTLGDLTGILEHSDSVVNDIINSYRMKTDALSADETQMAKNIALQTIGTNATQEEKDAVLQAVDAYYKKLNAIRAEEDAQKKANKEREKAVKLAQKEAELAFQDLMSGTDTVDLFALDQANAYEKWIESISTTSTRMAELRAEIEKTQAAVESGDLSSSVAAEYIADLNAQIKALDVNPFESMTQGAQDALQAMSGMFESGSKDAKKLAIAMQALNLVQAVGAVLNQGSGDPYTAFGRMAAMAAMVASLGISIGNLSGGFEDVASKRQSSQGLNSWGEKSESILEATEATANSTKQLVGINTDMLSALENLSMALSGASNIISRNTSIPNASVSVSGNVFSGLQDFFSGDVLNLTGKLLGDTFEQLLNAPLNFIGKWLGGSSSVADEGIRIIGGQLSDLIENVTVEAFQQVDYKKWKFGSKKTKTAFESLGDQVSNQFSLVFESLADTVATGAESLGLSTQAIEDAINNFVIGTSTISLKGLDADARVAEIEAYFSSVFNDLASTVIPFLDDFQKAGEELGETLSRLSTEASIGRYLIDNFNLELGSMSDVVWEGTGIWEGLKIRTANGVPQFLLVSNAISEMVGGVDEFASKVSSFTDSFASDQKKLDIYTSAMTKALEEVNLALPDTAKGFYDLFTSLDATTEIGQQQVAAILNIVDTADAYYAMLEKLTESGLDEEMSYLDGEISSLNSTLNSLTRGYSDAAESLFDVSYAMNSVALDSAIAAARLGDFSLADALDLSSLNQSKSDFSSALEFNLARAETAAKLNELQGLQDDAVDVNEKQLSVLEEIRDALNNNDTMANSSEVVDELALLREQSYKQSELTNQLLQRLAYTS